MDTKCFCKSQVIKLYHLLVLSGYSGFLHHSVKLVAMI